MNISTYCFRCGTALGEKLIENRNRLCCPACGWIYYAQLKVGAAALIENQGSLLLLRRAHQPWQGCWNLPAGYVEADEDPRCAAERETLEECGLQVHASSLVAGEFFDDDPRGNGLLLLYRCKIIGGNLHTNDENDAACFFSPSNLPEDLAGALHSHFIRRWAAGEYSS